MTKPLYLLAVFLYLSLEVQSHVTLIDPAPRTHDSGLKQSPCGGTHPSTPNPIGPGPYVIHWNETVCHNGSPFRISLALDNKDKSSVFNEYIIVNHIPHNDDCVPNQIYKYEIEIPDIKCDHCVLQLTQMMTDKDMKQCPGSYPEQWITYYSCADILINGKTPTDQYQHADQTPEGLMLGPYAYETGKWEDGLFKGSNEYIKNDICPDELPRICNSDVSKRHEKNDICIEWRVEESYITFIVETTAMGWVALGFSKSQDFNDEGDIYISTVNLETGITIVEDRHFEKESKEPVMDAHQDVESNTGLHIPSGEMIENVKVTRFSFTRKLSTGDHQDLDFAPGEKIYLIWNYHKTSQDFNEKGEGYTVSQKVDLFSSSPFTPHVNQSQKSHGLLMFFAWDIFAFIGILVARYMRDRKRWFLAHAFLELLACILAWSSLSVIYKHVSDAEAEHFKGWHPALGLFVITFSILQPIVGIISHLTREKNAHSTENKPKKIQNKIHIYLGRIGIAAALINLIAGLVNLNVGMTIVVLCGIFLFIQLIVVLFLEIRLRKSKSTKFNAGPIVIDDEDEDDEL